MVLDALASGRVVLLMADTAEARDRLHAEVSLIACDSAGHA
jgi:hypothetical protein